MAYEANIRQSYSSDIFHLHNLNKPEIKPTHHKRFTTHSFDCISSQPIDTILTKSYRINELFKSTVFSQEPLKHERGRKYLAKNTLILGTEDDTSYNIKREPKTNYNPDLHYPQLSAYERRIKQLHSTMKPNQESNSYRSGLKQYNSSVGAFDDEIRLTDNSQQLPKGTSRERKFYMVYHTNGDKMNWADFRKQIKQSRLINNPMINYNKDKGKEYPSNRVELLKSNIFFSPERETLNKNFIYSKAKDEQEYNSYSERTDHRKMNFRLRDNDFIYTKSTWKDDKIDLYYRQTSTGHEDITAYERKMTELYGRKNLPKLKKQTDAQTRELMKKTYHYNNPLDNDAKIRKQFEQISTLGNNTTANFKAIRVRKAENLSKNYEIDNYKNIKDANIDSIERELKREGIHVYNRQIDESYSDGKKKGKVSFSIRESHNDNEFMSKFNNALKKIKRETGLDITPSVSSSPSKRPR